MTIPDFRSIRATFYPSSLTVTGRSGFLILDLGTLERTMGFAPATPHLGKDVRLPGHKGVTLLLATSCR